MRLRIFLVALSLLNQGMGQQRIPADLPNQDLRNIERIFREHTLETHNVQALSKKRISVDLAALIAVDWIGEQQYTGLFIVRGPQNTVVRTLAIEAFDAVTEIKAASRESVDIALNREGSGYQGSIRYFYSLTDNSPVRRYRYGNLTVGEGRMVGSALRFDAESNPTLEGWPKQSAVIVLTPHSDGSGPDFRLTTAALRPDTAPHSDADWQAPGGAIVRKKTRQWDRGSGFEVVNTAGHTSFYPVPVPGRALVARMRPKDPPPDDLSNEVGGVVRVGDALWFGNAFYGGEGASGVGGLGEFSLVTHKYTMHYLATVSRWSTGLLVRDGDTFWMGLYHAGEQSGYSGGVASFNRLTGMVRRYPLDRYVTSVLPVRETVYCGSTDGIFMIRGSEITQLRFAPNRTGKLTMVAEKIR